LDVRPYNVVGRNVFQEKLKMAHMKGDCEGCKKQATVHLTEIFGGKKVEKHYCEACPKLTGESLSPKSHTPINELLTNFVLQHSANPKDATAVCEGCGQTWPDFKQSGLLGCENDYTIFERELGPIIQRAQEGAQHHVGKVPARRAAAAGAIVPKKKIDVAKLKRDLSKAVEAEDYERAAKIRDQIRQAETK